MQGFDHLSTDASKFLDLSLSQDQVDALNRYADLLDQWNQKINLTAIREPEEIRIKHFLDSLSCTLAIKDRPHASLIDVGTGAGFPGLPLKVLYPELQLTLVESVAKKAQFLNQVVQDLRLKQVKIVNARAETVGQQGDHRQRYDWAVARAVASLPVLCEYLLPLVRVGGYMLAQKGESAAAELDEALYAIQVLGGRHLETIPVSLTNLAEERFLIVIEKIAQSPENYPRRVGMPAKRPLAA